MDEQYIGQSFRQIATELRWRRDGKRTHSVRPQNPKTEAFLDLEDPTLITFEAGDTRIDPSSLLMTRAIAPYTPPRPKARPILAETSDPVVEEVV